MRGIAFWNVDWRRRPRPRRHLGREKMALARKLGADVTIDAKTQDPPKEIQKQSTGCEAGKLSGRLLEAVA